MITENRAARFHYEISERYEAGIVLRGSEIKALREQGAHLVDAYACVERGEVWLRGLHISTYSRAAPGDRASERAARKLLLHAREITAIVRAVSREGCTLVPLTLLIVGGLAKVRLGVARGRKAHDKRAALAARTAEREATIELRERRDAPLPRRRRARS